MKSCNFWLLAISNYFFDGLELPPLSDSFSRISFVLTHATIEYEIVKQNLTGKKGLVCEKKTYFENVKRWDVNWKTNDNDLPPSWSVNLSWVNELLSSPPPKIPISKIIWNIKFSCKYSLANEWLWPHFWIQTIQKFLVPKLPCWKNLMQGLCAPKRSDISQFIYV